MCSSLTPLIWELQVPHADSLLVFSIVVIAYERRVIIFASLLAEATSYSPLMKDGPVQSPLAHEPVLSEWMPAAGGLGESFPGP